MMAALPSDLPGIPGGEERQAPSYGQVPGRAPPTCNEDASASSGSEASFSVAVLAPNFTPSAGDSADLWGGSEGFGLLSWDTRGVCFWLRCPVRVREDECGGGGRGVGGGAGGAGIGASKRSISTVIYPIAAVDCVEMSFLIQLSTRMGVVKGREGDSARQRRPPLRYVG